MKVYVTDGEAEKWFHIAADLEYREAKKILNELLEEGLAKSKK